MAAHKGWLFLEAQKKPNSWSLRYFVLDEGYLRYFYQDDDLDRLPPSTYTALRRLPSQRPVSASTRSG